MATFKLNKGQSFQIQKEIQLVHSGLVWDPPEGSGPAFDLDVHCFALVHPGGDANRARLYNEGSHALCYAFVRSSGNPEGSLIKNADGSFQTDDGSMWHERDDRTGRGGLIKRSEPDDDGDEDGHGGGHHDEGFREEFKIVLAKLPAEVSELAVWATIHDAERKRQDFGKVKNAYIEVCDAMDDELCRYQLTAEFAGKTTIQVASFLKQPDGSWRFHAVGAGSNAGLGDVIQAYFG
ncbi:MULTISPECIES: TerD family protein [Rhizobium]|jgi:tellurium resistance protein TerD|uniref:Stress protein n=1 Tax=Rhizobium leguminosarum TaxID=384 RepID=A0A444NY62_RHILE|nr:MULTISPECIES: TerD family protein [Rhizobium]KPN27210.1 stress protein [Rhizobium brockwellii]MDV4156870.1 TerD family protein [Rhizobium brockwellii]QJX06912.1 stress protein [Rhizobium brockwellii]RWY80638.1 stress protein [Rhizobium leguminosarum]TAX40993.1 stress protein [Rhizobium leguminosarum]